MTSHVNPVHTRGRLSIIQPCPEHNATNPTCTTRLFAWLQVPGGFQTSFANFNRQHFNFNFTLLPILTTRGEGGGLRVVHGVFPSAALQNPSGEVILRGMGMMSVRFVAFMRQGRGRRQGKGCLWTNSGLFPNAERCRAAQTGCRADRHLAALT